MKTNLKKITMDKIEHVDEYGRTILYDAVINGHSDTVNELCSIGFNINHQDRDGKTPLHFACIYAHYDIVKLLIKKGANINIKDNNGNNAISDAIFNSNGDTKIIILLKENGADYISKNNHGISPKELANIIANFDVSHIFE